MIALSSTLNVVGDPSEMAHLTFWKQRLCVTLAAVIQSQTPPSEEKPHPLNAQVFEEQRRPCPVILHESDEVHANLRA